MFLEHNEHIIVMEDPACRDLSVKDLKKLQKAKIRTIEFPRAITYGTEWENTDSAIKRISKTNLKAQFVFYYSMQEVSFRDLIDNPDSVDNKLLEVLDRYSKWRHRLQIIYGLPQGGEFTWDAMQTNNYPATDEEIINFVIGRQKILVQQHGEIWLRYHNFLGHHNNWNNLHLPFLYEALRKEFPHVPIYSVQYAHFECGGTPTPKEMQYKVKEYAEKYDIRFFIGSQYCEGLSTNIDEAINQKAYGFVTSPMHTESKIAYNEVEDWMLPEIKTANERLRKAWK